MRAEQHLTAVRLEEGEHGLLQGREQVWQAAHALKHRRHCAQTPKRRKRALIFLFIIGICPNLCNSSSALCSQHARLEAACAWRARKPHSRSRQTPPSCPSPAVCYSGTSRPACLPVPSRTWRTAPAKHTFCMRQKAATSWRTTSSAKGAICSPNVSTSVSSVATCVSPWPQGRACGSCVHCVHLCKAEPQAATWLLLATGGRA